MAYNTKAIKTDVNGKPIPQMYDQLIDDYEALEGRGGASAIVAGRFWQVGAGATTTSIPMVSQSGLSISLSASNQSRLVGSTLEIVLGSTLAEAVVSAVSASGTLTLDSPLPSAPAQNMSFLLIPPEQTQLTGSNVTLPVNGAKATELQLVNSTQTIAAGASYLFAPNNVTAYSKISANVSLGENVSTTVPYIGYGVRDSAQHEYNVVTLVSVSVGKSSASGSKIDVTSLNARIYFYNADSIQHTMTFAEIMGYTN